MPKQRNEKQRQLDAKRQEMLRQTHNKIFVQAIAEELTETILLRLKDEGFKDRKELSEKMFDLMKKYGGIGLSANQVGLPFNMFVLGDHPDLEKGLKMTCFNPMIINSSKEVVAMKEGCLTFPFVFLTISRPRKVTVKYEDENGDLKEGHLDGMISRIFQHEYDHMLGRTFTEYASKMKLDMAYKKAQKMMNKYSKKKK